MNREIIQNQLKSGEICRIWPTIKIHNKGKGEKIKIRGKIWKLIREMYIGIVTSVKLNGVRTNNFWTEEGILQGSVLGHVLSSLSIS